MAADFKPLGGPGSQNDHDRRDVDHKVILFVASLILGMALVIHLTLYFLLGHFKHSTLDTWAQVPPGAARAADSPAPPAPRLQVRPETELDAERAEADRELNSYGWSSPARTQVRVPIEQAKTLLLRRGSAGAWHDAKGARAATDATTGTR